MFYKRTGYPEESELVICTVSKIQFHSVFVNIDEYGISGMIHISEIAPGRIRNIRDYVKEGKVVVCKVLRIHEDKGHVDLSLRRVTDTQRRLKVNEMKHEKMAESIIEVVAKSEKIPSEKLYNLIMSKIKKEYEFVFEIFEDVVENDVKLVSYGIDKSLAEKLEEIVRQRIKPKEVEISGTVEITSYDGKGVEIVRNALLEAQKTEGLIIRYLGGGKYKFLVKSTDYKLAEAQLDKATSIVTELIKKKKGFLKYTRDPKK
ncbi:MAG: S1 RNA-binding domain-containing protein [Nanoarchaeota archaeon]|nr:S1 RNA-binding domain-containing protein [Nanoarchaeota archaeon]